MFYCIVKFAVIHTMKYSLTIKGFVLSHFSRFSPRNGLAPSAEGVGYRIRAETSSGANGIELKLSALLNHNCESRLVALSSCYVFYHSKSQ